MSGGQKQGPWKWVMNSLMFVVAAAAALPATSSSPAVADDKKTEEKVEEKKDDKPVAAQPVYELRIYTTLEGRLPALNARFKNHTIPLFEKHGMKNVAYWIPTDPVKSQNTLIYILEHKSMDAAKKSWNDFRNDPEWKKAQRESEKDGKIVASVESTFMTAAEYSPPLKK